MKSGPGGKEKGSILSIRGQPLHVMLVPYPIAFLTALPVADWLFLITGDPFYARGAFWLGASGLVTGFLAAAAGRLDFLTIRDARETLSGWLHAGGFGVVLLITIVNLWLRVDFPEDFVAPWGVTLSTVAGVLTLWLNYLGGRLLLRHGLGIRGVEREGGDRRPPGD